MKEFPLEDFIQEEKPTKKPTKHQRPKNEKTLGKELLEAIETFDMAMREIYRPLGNEESKKLEALVNEAQQCSPTSEDLFMMRKILDMMERAHQAKGEAIAYPRIEEKEVSAISFIEDTSNSFEMAFKIGMAYERLKSKD